MKRMPLQFLDIILRQINHRLCWLFLDGLAFAAMTPILRMQDGLACLSLADFSFRQAHLGVSGFGAAHGFLPSVHGYQAPVHRHVRPDQPDRPAWLDSAEEA